MTERTAQPTVAIPIKARPHTRSDRRYFLAMAIAILLISLVGFAPSFFLRGIVLPAREQFPLTPLIVAHALMATTWLLLFIAQSFIAGPNIKLHRRLGYFTAALTIVYIPVSIGVVIQQAVRELNLAGDPPLQFFAIPLFDVIVFTIFFCAALRNLKRPAWHKRFMLGAAAAMVSAGAARIGLPDPWLAPTLGFSVPLLVIGSMGWWDRHMRGSITRPTKIAFAIVLSSDIVRLVLARQGWWQDIVGVIVNAAR